MSANFDDPHTCPWCGRTEANAFLLQNNHWVKPEGHAGYDWCKDHGMCIAMDLTRNHVLYYARLLTDPTYSRPSYCQFHERTHPWKADCSRAMLREEIKDVERVWPPDRLDWLDEYRILARDLEAPAHQAGQFGDQLDLLAGA